MAADDVKTKLREAGISQAAMARRIGCTRAAVNQVLLSRATSPYVQEAMAQVLGVAAKDLWGEAWWFLHYRKRRSA
jgi:lambda repressor-like predicted transcriptional regulator